MKRNIKKENIIKKKTFAFKAFFQITYFSSKIKLIFGCRRTLNIRWCFDISNESNEFSQPGHCSQTWRAHWTVQSCARSITFGQGFTEILRCLNASTALLLLVSEISARLVSNRFTFFFLRYGGKCTRRGPCRGSNRFTFCFQK